MRALTAILGVALTDALSSTPFIAAELTGTLKKIKTPEDHHPRSPRLLQSLLLYCRSFRQADRRNAIAVD